MRPCAGHIRGPPIHDFWVAEKVHVSIEGPFVSFCQGARNSLETLAWQSVFVFFPRAKSTTPPRKSRIGMREKGMEGMLTVPMLRIQGTYAMYQEPYRDNAFENGEGTCCLPQKWYQKESGPGTARVENDRGSMICRGSGDTLTLMFAMIIGVD